MDAMGLLRESLANAPVIWKGDYPYFIHPITDGVPRLDAKVLSAVTDLSIEAIDWSTVDLILGIEAMGLPLTSPH
jgi:adenine phosphoribosyltransferase